MVTRKTLSMVYEREEIAMEEWLNTEYSGDKISTAQDAFMFKNKHWEKRDVQGRWANHLINSSVFQLLIDHPIIIIDFGAWSESEFIEAYGVTAKQMSFLADEGMHSF